MVRASRAECEFSEGEVSEGKLQNLLRAHDKDVVGVSVHPHRNLVATWASDDRTLKLWHAGGAG